MDRRGFLRSLVGGVAVGAAVTVPGIFSSSVTGSPVTTTGTLADTITLVNENANTVWSGPASGAAGVPAFRALVAADLPVPDRIDQVDLKYWGVDWGSGETTTVWYVHPSQAAAWKDLGGIAYYTPELGTARMTWLNLARSPYPGRLSAKH
jgi:hypothetical protein